MIEYLWWFYIVILILYLSDWDFWIYVWLRFLISVIGWVGYVGWFFGKIDMAHMDLRRKNDVMLMSQPLGYHGAATSKDQPSFGARRLQKTWRLTRTLWSSLFCSSPLFCCFLISKMRGDVFSKITMPFWPKWSFTHYPSISMVCWPCHTPVLNGCRWCCTCRGRACWGCWRLGQRRMGTLHGWKIVYKWRFQWKIIKWGMFHCHGWLPEGMHDWDGGATCSDFNET